MVNPPPCGRLTLQPPGLAEVAIVLPLWTMSQVSPEAGASLPVLATPVMVPGGSLRFASSASAYSATGAAGSPATHRAGDHTRLAALRGGLAAARRRARIPNGRHVAAEQREEGAPALRQRSGSGAARARERYAQPGCVMQ